MKKLAITSALAATLSLSACATNPYGYNDPYYGNQYNNGSRVAGGAAGGVGDHLEQRLRGFDRLVGHSPTDA